MTKFNFTLIKFPALLLVLFLVDFVDLAAGKIDLGGLGIGSGKTCSSGSDCPSEEGCYDEIKSCVNCKLAAKADKYPSGCIPWSIVIGSLVCSVIFGTIIAIVICWFVAACPLYKWRMGRNRQGARGYGGGGGGSRAQSPRNVSKPASKTSQNPRSKPASASASKASQKR